jgi:hypothetical protein
LGEGDNAKLDIQVSDLVDFVVFGVVEMVINAMV